MDLFDESVNLCECNAIMQCNDAVFTFIMCVFFLANKKETRQKKLMARKKTRESRYSAGSRPLNCFEFLKNEACRRGGRATRSAKCIFGIRQAMQQGLQATTTCSFLHLYKH